MTQTPYIESDGGGYWCGATYHEGRRTWYIVTDGLFGRIDCESKADAVRKLEQLKREGDKP